MIFKLLNYKEYRRLHEHLFFSDKPMWNSHREYMQANFSVLKTKIRTRFISPLKNPHWLIIYKKEKKWKTFLKWRTVVPYCVCSTVCVCSRYRSTIRFSYFTRKLLLLLQTGVWDNKWLIDASGNECALNSAGLRFSLDMNSSFSNTNFCFFTTEFLVKNVSHP